MRLTATPEPDDLAALHTIVDMMAEFDVYPEPILITGQLPGLYAHKATLDDIRDYVRERTH